MTGFDPELDDLPAATRAELVRAFVAFDRGWRPGALARAIDDLPAAAPWRRAAGVELMKIDLEKHWASGRPSPLADHRRRYRELDPAGDFPAELVALDAEFRAEFGSRLRETGEPDDTRPVAECFGRYRILRTLGQGGMGIVYLARDPQLDREVALKLPLRRRAGDPAEAARLFREARAAAGLSHPNICRVYEVGEADGVPYLICEYIDGETLAVTAKRSPPPSASRAAELVAAVARAVGYAHRNGVIHRDLKPANIMLTPAGRPVVMDFGLARRVAPGAAPHATMSNPAGTPEYMAPEQVADDRAGPASDQFALGVVLYELLTGRTPFRARNALEVWEKLVRDPVPPPSAHRPGIPAELEATCLRALAKRPADRFADLEEFAAALEGLRPQPAKRRWRWVAGAAVLLVAAVALAFVAWRAWSGGGVGRGGEVVVPQPISKYMPAYQSLPGFNPEYIRKREFWGKPVPTTTAEWIAVLSLPPPKDAADKYKAVGDKLLAIEELGRRELGRRDAVAAIPPLIELLRANGVNQNWSIRREGAHLLGYLGRDRGSGPDTTAVASLAARVADELWLKSNGFKEGHAHHNPFLGPVTDPVHAGKGAALAALEALDRAEVRPALLKASKSANDDVAAWARREWKERWPNDPVQ